MNLVVPILFNNLNWIKLKTIVLFEFIVLLYRFNTLR